MQKILFILAAILLVSTLAKANNPSDVYNNNALKGLTTTKAYFDVTIGEPKQLLLRLQLIEKTYNQILAEGVTPIFIVGIRGKASNFFTKGSGYVLDIDLPEKQQIAVLVKSLPQ